MRRISWKCEIVKNQPWDKRILWYEIIAQFEGKLMTVKLSPEAVEFGDKLLFEHIFKTMRNKLLSA